MIQTGIRSLVRRIRTAVRSRWQPYRRTLAIRNRGEVRIRSHRGDDIIGNRLWPDRPKVIGLHGGLGDVIILLPAIRKYKLKYSNRLLRVVYTDVRSDVVDPSTYGLGLTRLEQTTGGAVVNPIRDFLENVSFIDELVGGDPTLADEYWYPDPPFRRRWGEHPTPTRYRADLFAEVFTADDARAAGDFWDQNSLWGKFVVAFHFRRAADKIAEVFRILSSDPEMRPHLRCILMGSSRNEHLPEIETTNRIDLFDNYTKGVPLRILLQIMMRCGLYIGGRGSFEQFSWIAGVPSINLIDRECYELHNRLYGCWIPEFWSENRFTDRVFFETADPRRICDSMIKPYFIEWLERQVDDGERHADDPEEQTIDA
jgi:hypothetical protein